MYVVGTILEAIHLGFLLAALLGAGEVVALLAVALLEVEKEVQ